VFIGKFPGAAAGLVGLLSSRNNVVQSESARALWALAADCRANQVLIGEYPGAVAGLVGLLSSNKSDGEQHQLRNRAMFKVLFVKWKSKLGISEVEKIATLTLGALAANCPANQVLIGEYPGAVAGLVGLLSNSKSDVQEAAAGALWALAAICPTNQVLIGECSGAVARLKELLSSSNRDVRQEVEGALGSLATNCPTDQLVIGKSLGAGVDRDGLVNSNSSVHEQATWAPRDLPACNNHGSQVRLNGACATSSSTASIVAPSNLSGSAGGEVRAYLVLAVL
jgi:hypothetical protein